MATVQEQIAQARAAGYSDSEIAAKLSAAPMYGDKIKMATQAGYSPDDIISHLSGAATTAGQQNPPSSGLASQFQRIASDGSEIAKSPWQSVIDLGTKGLGETALNAVTGIGSSIAGGLRGLATLATGGSAQDATDAIHKTQQDYTYQPRTAVGKLGSELMSLPMNAAKSATSTAGGYIGEAVGGEKGRLIGETLGEATPDVVGTFMGGRAALKSSARPMASPIAEAPKPTNYDIPTFLRRQEAATPAAAIEPVTPTIDLTKYVTDRDFMATLSDADRADLLSNYTTANHPSATPAVRQAAANDGASIVGRNMAAREPAIAPITPEPIQSPLTTAANPIADQITAGLRDTSDIDATLAEFGIESPKPAAPTIEQPTVSAVAAKVEPAPPIAAAVDTTAPAAAPVAASETIEPASAAERPVVANDPLAEPIVGHPNAAPPADMLERFNALQDVGMESKRRSALSGDAAAASREYQNSKITSQPAGQFWNDQFAHETEVMKNFTQGIIERTGGRTGLDSVSLERKGMDIAAPYDAARAYFEDAKKALYDEADRKAAETGKPVSTQSVEKLLDDPDFRATLMAKDQQSLLKTIESQLERFKSLDPNGLSVKNAENFRKWLNSVWSPDKSETLGAVKGAIDEDVFRSAGGDVYAQARAMHQLEKKTLDNPNGIARIMDTDPNTPINRITPYEKIPDKILTLSNQQFEHIVSTYRDLPPELQPMVQQAINTLKSHFSERMLNAGSESGFGNPRELWNSGGVQKLINDNSAKVGMLFDAGELTEIGKLLKAGEIIRTNSKYSGAAAQKQNALAAGIGESVAHHAMGGGVTGMVGRAVLGGVVDSLSARRALANAKAATMTEWVPDNPTPKNPIEAWEMQSRKAK